ncbi:MAG: hypothetical protein JWO36_4543 [Myxococcales bacterium]|nr:hypothetical protein [Myxococcales bacterium]
MIVMFVWLMVPVAKCTYSAFREIPIGEVDAEQVPGQVDRERLNKYDGFLDHFGSAVKQCYQRTPLLGQQRWKSDLLIGFAALMVVTGIISRIMARRKHRMLR